MRHEGRGQKGIADGGTRAANVYCPNTTATSVRDAAARAETDTTAVLAPPSIPAGKPVDGEERLNRSAPKRLVSSLPSHLRKPTQRPRLLPGFQM